MKKPDFEFLLINIKLKLYITFIQQFQQKLKLVGLTVLKMFNRWIYYGLACPILVNSYLIIFELIPAALWAWEPNGRNWENCGHWETC